MHADMTMHIKYGGGVKVQDIDRVTRDVEMEAIDEVERNGFPVGSPKYVTVNAVTWVPSGKYFLCEVIVEWDENWETIM